MRQPLIQKVSREGAKAAKVLLILAVVGLVLSVGAETYYIDYAGGSDANAGTSTGAAWKRHPYMTNFTGSYAHTAGDTFIFKGGVTWPAVAFPMTITAGGSADVTRDSYRADASWYSGGSWSRPVFDFENTWIGGYGIKVDGVDFITFSDLDIKRHRGRWISEGGYFGTYTLQIYGEADSITVSNCWIRDWSLSMPWPGGANQDDGNSGGILLIPTGTGGDDMIVRNCWFTQNGAAGGFVGGDALKGGGLIYSNRFEHVCDALIGGGTVVSNTFLAILDATDPDLHEDVIYITAVSTVAGNYISNCTAAAPVIYLEPTRSSVSGTTLVYNNVAFNTGYPPLSIDLSVNDGSPHTIKIFNNTVEHGGSSCLRVVDRGNPLGALHVTNNFFVTSAEPYAIPAGTVESLTSGNNVTNTASAADSVGATEARSLQPTNTSWAGYQTGRTLAEVTNDFWNAARNAPFDVGYVNVVAGGSPPPDPPAAGAKTYVGKLTLY